MSGLHAQIGVAAETTYGQAVTVDHFYPFTDEGLEQEIERLESEGIIAGARVIRSEQWSPGARSLTGDIGLELFQQNMALLFSHMLGSISSSATGGIATHTVTPGDLTGKSLTVQKGVPTPGGSSVVPLTWAGTKIQSWEIGLTAGEIATLGLSTIAQTETDQIALATASYGTNAARPYTFVHGTVSIAGTDECVREMSIECENNLADDRQCIGQDFIDEPVEMDRREITGTMTLEFTSTQQYQRFTAGSELSVTLSLSASASAQATIAMNVRYDGTTPTVGGRDLVVPDVPFKCIASSTDSSAFRAVIVNSQTTP